MSEIGHDISISKENLTEMLNCPRQFLQGRYNCRVDHHDIFTFSLQQLRKYKDYDYFLKIILCPVCGANTRNIDAWATQEEYVEHFDQVIHSMKLSDKKIQARPKKHRGYELGAREFTLTYSPKWMDDNTARLELTKAITKLLKYYADEIIELRAVGEVGSNGLSHIHCFYKLVDGLKMTDKNFKRAWKYWNPKKRLGNGFEGGHHQSVRQESDFRGYIEKDIDTAWYQVTRNRSPGVVPASKIRKTSPPIY